MFRWQLFTHDAGGDVVWCYSIERTSDGLFDTRGAQPLTCTDHPDVYALTAGTCPRPAVADPTDRVRQGARRAVPDGGASRTGAGVPRRRLRSRHPRRRRRDRHRVHRREPGWRRTRWPPASGRSSRVPVTPRRPGRRSGCATPAACASGSATARRSTTSRLRRPARVVRVEPPGRDLRCWTSAGICQWHSSVRVHRTFGNAVPSPTADRGDRRALSRVRRPDRRRPGLVGSAVRAGRRDGPARDAHRTGGRPGRLLAPRRGTRHRDLGRRHRRQGAARRSGVGDLDRADRDGARTVPVGAAPGRPLRVGRPRRDAVLPAGERRQRVRRAPRPHRSSRPRG